MAHNFSPAFVSTLQEVADYYERATPILSDETMRARYARLHSELWAQFHTLRAFVNVEFTAIDPYKNSADMFRSIADYHTLFVYTGSQPPTGHPMADFAPNGQTWNSIFRAVHDGLAHYPARHSFSLRGELRAYRAHCRLLSRDARHALATETIGQNCTYHFGRQSVGFPPQKSILLPEDLAIKVLESLEY